MSGYLECIRPGTKRERERREDGGDGVGKVSVFRRYLEERHGVCSVSVRTES